MKCTIFYSWQSDLPGATNRNFIQDALEQAVKILRADDSIQVEPVIERDTSGVPGAPNITTAIFTKIDHAQVFVGDVSIIHGGGPPEAPARPTPNPNVLVELGYALKTLGDDYLILVVNTAFGKPEVLPFDLRIRRVLTYEMPLEADGRAAVRKELANSFVAALRIILTQLEATPVTPPLPAPGALARTAIEHAQANQTILVRQFMSWLEQELIRHAPDFTRTDEPRDELLVQALEQTPPLVIEMARLAETIATVNAVEAAKVVYKQFGQILNHYDLPSGFSGSYQETDFDFYKFLGHELFVTFFAFLIKEDRWELIADLLDEGIYVANSPQRRAGVVPYGYASEQVQLLIYRNQRLQSRQISIHADLLNQRHSQGELGALVPAELFMETDLFLLWRSDVQRVKRAARSDWTWINWTPWSIVYMGWQMPRYLLKAASSRYAQQLLRPLGVDDIPALRSFLAEQTVQIRYLFGGGARMNPLRNLDVRQIGSQ